MATAPNWDGILDCFICDGFGHVEGRLWRDVDNVGLQASKFSARKFQTPISLTENQRQATANTHVASDSFDNATKIASVTAFVPRRLCRFRSETGKRPRPSVVTPFGSELKLNGVTLKSWE